MAKSKAQSNPFAFVRSLFGKSESKTDELKVEQRKADEGVLDRVASLNLSIAEHFAPLAVQTQDPNLLQAVLGASREARACVEARKDVTGGGLAGGTQSTEPTPTEKGVVMRVDHHGPDGQWKSDDFHDSSPSSNDPSIPVQARSSSSEQ